MVILKNVFELFGKSVEVIQLLKLFFNFEVYAGSLNPSEIVKFRR
jgi:hypothetical protein